MTGIDNLWEKLREMGISKNAARSKTVDAMLAIFADPDNCIGAYEALEGVKKMHEDAVLEVNRERVACENRRFELQDREAEIRKRELDFSDKLEQLAEKEDRLKRLQKELSAVETQEARDRLRMAMMYESATEKHVKTNGYAETAYVKYLGAILAGGVIYERGESISDDFRSTTVCI